MARDPRYDILFEPLPIGPAGPADHVDWELNVKPLRAQASGSLE